MSTTAATASRARTGGPQDDSRLLEHVLGWTLSSSSPCCSLRPASSDGGPPEEEPRRCSLTDRPRRHRPTDAPATLPSPH
ncbi:SCO1431 family membrane protein [Streptomyces platensis]|uniref:SCO1431 family membrane protein n=1 Tax=Streptomyces platensis TaxID=58346 RepID=UPI0034D67B64|nr:SCO1431 family membrane protein [Streptomyces platensis]